MKGFFAILIVALGAAFALSHSALPSQQVQFEKALALEEAQGNLREAIALYQKIVDESNDQALAAHAQLRIGMCHQKLGHKEAQSAFQKVIENYPNQTEMVRLARERLLLLVKAQAVVDRKDHEPTIRQVWSGPETDTDGAPSPDGKYLSFVDWGTGDLAVRDLKTGNNRRLTNKGPWGKSSDEAGSSIWSPDGNQIAFEWLCAVGNYGELRVMGLSGSQPRTLYSSGKDEWVSLYDWSPDGKQILASIPAEKLALISLVDGSIQVLKTLSRDPSKAKFSPDGRYIIFDTPQSTDSLDRDIHVMSIEDAHDRLLVSHAADDSILGWTPDGKFVLFLSDRTGSPCFWLLPVADGKPGGNPQLIRTASRNTNPLGFSRDGRFFYGESKSISDIYTVNLNPVTGTVLGPPEKIIDRFEGSNFSPSYSPDGRYLAYCSQRGRSLHPTQGGNVLCIHSMDSGEDKEFSKGLRKLGVGYISRPRWAPDGKSIVIHGIAKTVGGSGGTYVVDLQTEVVTEVLYSGKDVQLGGAVWSSDGKSIIFSRFDKKKSLRHLVMRNLETGNEKILYELPESPNPDFAISPDFQQLCLLIRESGKRVFRIMRVSAGEPRVLREFSAQERSAWFTWAGDAKYILFSKRVESVAEWQLWRLSIATGKPELLGLMPSHYRGDLSAHPDGKRIAFSGGSWGGTTEIWIMENFLPNDR